MKTQFIGTATNCIQKNNGMCFAHVHILRRNYSKNNVGATIGRPFNFACNLALIWIYHNAGNRQSPRHRSFLLTFTEFGVKIVIHLIRLNNKDNFNGNDFYTG